MDDENMTAVLREALRRLVGHLEKTALYDEAWDDYSAARMYVGRACGDWDSEAAERAHGSIRSAAGVVDRYIHPEVLGYFGLHTEKDLWHAGAEQVLLTNVAKAAEDLAVIINVDPKGLDSRPRLEIEAFRKLVESIQKLKLVTIKDMSFTGKGHDAQRDGCPCNRRITKEVASDDNQETKVPSL
jgi:hypothetical protein